MKAPLLNLLIPSALTCLISATTAHAQPQRNVKKTIIVTNGDTTINGKRLAEMDRKEREKHQKEFSEKEKEIIESVIDALINNGHQGEIVIRKFRKGSSPFDVRLHRFDNDSLKLSADSISWHFRRPIQVEDLQILPEDVLHRIPPFKELGSRERKDAELSANSQQLHFSSTDKDGFATHVDFRITEADQQQSKKITGKDSAVHLAVDDFTLFPNFSSGKTGLSFQVATKGIITVSLMNSDGKVVFSEKTSGSGGSYIKQLNMTKNGVYFVALSQNGKWFIRKVTKV